MQTGASKTLAVVLPWLWRLMKHSNLVVRAAKAGWLVYVLRCVRLIYEPENRSRVRNLEQCGYTLRVPCKFPGKVVHRGAAALDEIERTT